MPISLQLLFPGELDFARHDLAKALASHPLNAPHTETALILNETGNGTFEGYAALGADHNIQILGINVPIPDEVFENTLQVSHCSQEDKQIASTHQSHILLCYDGYSDDPLIQYDVLTMVAGVFADAGAAFIVNLHACSCIPAQMISPTGNASLKTTFDEILLPLLYGGFVKYFIEGQPGCWVRTMAASTLNLPDLAVYLVDSEEAEYTMFLLYDLVIHQLNTGNIFASGHAVNCDNQDFLLREPNEHEYFLKGEDSILVIEPNTEITSDEASTTGKTH